MRRSARATASARTSRRRAAAPSCAHIDAVVLIEPVSGADRYPLRTAADVKACIEYAQALVEGEEVYLTTPVP